MLDNWLTSPSSMIESTDQLTDQYPTFDTSGADFIPRFKQGSWSNSKRLTNLMATWVVVEKGMVDTMTRFRLVIT